MDWTADVMISYFSASLTCVNFRILTMTIEMSTVNSEFAASWAYDDPTEPKGGYIAAVRDSNLDSCHPHWTLQDFIALGARSLR